jgi:hypothetical protein
MRYHSSQENDIMWGGGMPDDITIVALRVIAKKAAASFQLEDDHETHGDDDDVVSDTPLAVGGV